MKRMKTLCLVTVAFACGFLLCGAAAQAWDNCDSCTCEDSCTKVCAFQLVRVGIDEWVEEYTYCGDVGVCAASASCESACPALACTTTVYGTNGNDTITGTASHECIWGYDGSDWIDGKAGDDHVWGGNGDDTMYGDSGNDCLYGQAGTDSADGGSGTDLCMAEGKAACEQ